MGIIIHSLESVSFKDLYAAFSSAFKDYDFSLNADELRRMLDRRGYNPQLSFGAFFEGRLISFVFNGTGMYNNILTAYDTGTGTVPSFRGLHPLDAQRRHDAAVHHHDRLCRSTYGG